MGTQINLDSFKEIYSNTYNSTLKYIICKCANLDDVNDIIQETYLELYKILEKKKQLEIDNVNGYIVSISKNKIKKYYTIKYKLSEISMSFTTNDISLEDTIKSEIDIEDIIINKVDLQIMWEFIKTKKVIIGKIFYLHYCMDMSIKDISEELNISESKTKNSLYRTLKELKTFFEKESEVKSE